MRMNRVGVGDEWETEEEIWTSHENIFAIHWEQCGFFM